MCQHWVETDKAIHPDLLQALKKEHSMALGSRKQARPQFRRREGETGHFPVPQINSWKLREKDKERESGVQII